MEVFIIGHIIFLPISTIKSIDNFDEKWHLNIIQKQESVNLLSEKK